MFRFLPKTSEATIRKRHLPFRPGLIFTAIILSLIFGFALGAYMVFVLGFGYPPPTALGEMIQVHGHVQLFGWTGFFIMAISLYKIPRLTSSRPVSLLEYYSLSFCLVAGLLLRVFGQLGLAHSPDASLLRTAVVAGCILEGIAALIFVFSILQRILFYRAQKGAFAAASLKPFLVLSAAGWLTYAGVLIYLGFLFIKTPGSILDPLWSEFGTKVYIHLILLPTCFAFSLATFPIFLRLAAPTWPVHLSAFCYALGAVLYLAAAGFSVPRSTDPSYWLYVSGLTIRLIAIAWIIFGLDLLRRRPSWFEKFHGVSSRANRPPRPRAADYGQFGNFERLIYAAYTWLILGVVAECFLLFLPQAFSLSVVRHLYLLGFVTHLILGMAVRMIPGFLGKNSIAYQGLVRASFVLILFATVARTLPLTFSLSKVSLLRGSYALSGIAAILAIFCLGVNVGVTFLQEKKRLSV